MAIQIVFEILCLLAGIPGAVVSIITVRDRIRAKREARWGVTSAPAKGIALPIALTAVCVLSVGVGIALLFNNPARSNAATDTGRPGKSTSDLMLDLEHGFTMVATDPDTGNTLFVVSGAIINSRGPETATTDWQMWLDHLQDGETLHGSMIPNLPSDSDLRIRYPSLNGTFVVQPSKFWPELTSQPMKAGSVNMGWIWCEFPITLYDLDKQEQSAVLHVQFEDLASGKPHVATVAMNTASRFTNPPWFRRPSHKGVQK